MTTTDDLIARLRITDDRIDRLEAADLIEQQAARIAELEARAGEAVAYANARHLAEKMASVPAFRERTEYYDVPLYLHPPTGDAAGKDSVDAARYRWLRDPAHNGFELDGHDRMGCFHTSQKVGDGLAHYYVGKFLDAAIDDQIAAIASLTKTADGEKQS